MNATARHSRGNEHQALLEAMEQQTISIAKGGLICQLRAKTSVMAAANPCGGHYKSVLRTSKWCMNGMFRGSRAKTVSENLKISPMILSRFDLVFILLDQVDEEKDTLLSEHLMAVSRVKAACSLMRDLCGVLAFGLAFRWCKTRWRGW